MYQGFCRVIQHLGGRTCCGASGYLPKLPNQIAKLTNLLVPNIELLLMHRPLRNCIHLPCCKCRSAHQLERRIPNPSKEVVSWISRPKLLRQPLELANSVQDPLNLLVFSNNVIYYSGHTRLTFLKLYFHASTSLHQHLDQSHGTPL